MMAEVNLGEKVKVCERSCQARKGVVDFVREEYKRYKRRDPPPDFSDVVDFGNELSYKDRVTKHELQHLSCGSKWLRCGSEWKVFGLKSCPGFYFIPNPFLPGAQKYWIKRCVRDFPKKPNVCNLDTHMKLEEADSVWDMSQSDGESPDLINKLSWVHLGYKFDYNNVDYVPEKYFGFPKDLAELCQEIALAIGYPGYHPETGIINYYPLSRSMGGHTDHYEEDLSYPLLSFSFGQSAIFLVGGKTRDIRPTALFIHSGDIVILSGESRLAFHAVPRILKVSEHFRHVDENYLKPTDITRQSCEVNGKGKICKAQRNAESERNGKMGMNDNRCKRCEKNEVDKSESQVKEKQECKSFADQKCCRRSESVLKQDEKNEKCEIRSERDEELDDTSTSCDFTGKELDFLTEYISRTRININVRQVHCYDKQT